MASNKAPKQWCLTKVETVNSYENWRQNLLYTLSLDTNFTRFLEDDSTWGKKTKAAPFRGFTDDGQEVPGLQRRTRQQKVRTLDLMLGQIANWTPIIARNTIVNNSTRLRDILANNSSSLWFPIHWSTFHILCRHTSGS